MSADRGRPAPLDRDPLEALATEFVERLRLGERPSAAEYAAMHPELANDIHELFPALAAMEGAKVPKEQIRIGGTISRTTAPERLGDFRIIREIGRGGMGIVYEAEQESLERRVAVKVLPKSAFLAPKQLERFQREARTAAGLHHTNIVPVFGVGHHDGFHFYVMQKIGGVGLDRVLSRLEHGRGDAPQGDLISTVRELLEEHRTAPPLPAATAGPPGATPLDSGMQPTLPMASYATAPAAAPQIVPASPRPPASARTTGAGPSYWSSVARLGIQVADALHYAHVRGTLHRDIKPANLIIDSQGVVWVADFGLAKALEHDRVSRTGEIVGTLAYMAPEQLQGKADRQSDIYSLGLTLYELLTLKPAFPEDQARLHRRMAGQEPPAPRKAQPEIPRDLETIVLKAIAHEPQARYSSAAELAADLERYLEDRPIHARRATAAQRLWQWCRRNPVVAGLSVTAATFLLLVAVTASIGYVRTTRALAGERAERKRAEAATDVAVQVLDRIYERFAPRNRDIDLTSDVADAGSGSGTAAAKPVLSEGAAAVLEDLLVFYDRLAESGGSDSKYQEKIALANQRVGDIRHHLGQVDQAKAAYERALDDYQSFHQSSGDDRCLNQIGAIYIELGILAHRTRHPDQARKEWEAAIEMLEKADKAGVATAESRRDADRAHELLAMRGPVRPPPPDDAEPRGPIDGPGMRGGPLEPPARGLPEVPPFEGRPPGPRRPPLGLPHQPPPGGEHLGRP